MGNSVTPLNLTAAALTVLQTRRAAVLSSVKNATDAERYVADGLAEASDKLAEPAASGPAIPRGQILNILV